MVQNVMHTLYLENLSRVKEFLLSLCILTSYGDSRVQKKCLTRSVSFRQFVSIRQRYLIMYGAPFQDILFVVLQQGPYLCQYFLDRLDRASTLIITSLYSKNGSLFLVLFFLSLSTLRIRFVTYSPIHVKNDANDVTWDTSGVIIITQNINNVEM